MLPVNGDINMNSENKIESFKDYYGFLSNFYRSSAGYDGVIYPTSEHAYQAAKTLDKNERARILKAHSPGKAKRLGQKVTKREDWEEIKVCVMYGIVYDKFNRHPMLAFKLIKTRGIELVEGNTWNDIFWGVCDGVGLNHLGKILMKVRNEVKI